MKNHSPDRQKYFLFYGALLLGAVMMYSALISIEPDRICNFCFAKTRIFYGLSLFGLWALFCLGNLFLRGEKLARYRLEAFRKRSPLAQALTNYSLLVLTLGLVGAYMWMWLRIMWMEKDQCKQEHWLSLLWKGFYPVAGGAFLIFIFLRLLPLFRQKK